MKKSRNASAPDAPENPRLPLTRRNYLVLLAGVGVILLGLLLMAGGSSSPETFDYDVFSWRRITLAPILVVGGFAIEIYGLMQRF